MIERLFFRVNPCNKLDFLSREAADCLVMLIQTQLLLNDFFWAEVEEKNGNQLTFMKKYWKILTNF